MNPANTLLTPQDQDDPHDAIIQPGEQPPFLIPWCASCKDGVELFTMDAITSIYRIGLHVQCHGKTQSVWLTPDDIFARKRDGKPVIVFKRGVFDRVR